MTFDEAVAVLQQTEQAMQTALAEERYEDAQSMGRKSVELVKTLTSLGMPSERRDEFLSFAQAYSEYARSLIASLTEEREKIRQELIGLHKSSKANRSYGMVNNMSRT
ncbi:MAG: hypothetical protein K6F05_02645 [Succinivibrio sp.]|nr:hypothetical protein [Succinivibrio sp.]